MNFDSMGFGLKIKEKRKAIGCTQGQFAARLGIKLSTLASYEESRAYPKPDVLKKIVDSLEVTTENLYAFLFIKN